MATTSSNVPQQLKPPKVIPAKQATVHRSTRAQVANINKAMKGNGKNR